MTLRKWKSNCQTVMNSITESLCETCNDSDLLFPSQSPKALGIHWITSTDKLFISVPALKPRETTTKRTIASDCLMYLACLHHLSYKPRFTFNSCGSLDLAGMIQSLQSSRRSGTSWQKSYLNSQLSLFADLTII